MKVTAMRISVSKVVLEVDDEMAKALDGQCSVEKFDEAYAKAIQLAEDVGLELDHIDYDFEVEE